jgi:serine/threonine protein kinase
VTAYTAPEQLDASGVASSATDVYRLGAVAHYVLTEEPPVDTNESEYETLPTSIREGATTLASEGTDLPAAVIDVLATAMASDPNDRYDSAYEFRDVLAGVLE